MTLLYTVEETPKFPVKMTFSNRMQQNAKPFLCTYFQNKF